MAKRIRSVVLIPLYRASSSGEKIIFVFLFLFHDRWTILNVVLAANESINMDASISTGSMKLLPLDDWCRSSDALSASTWPPSPSASEIAK